MDIILWTFYSWNISQEIIDLLILKLVVLSELFEFIHIWLRVLLIFNLANALMLPYTYYSQLAKPSVPEWIITLQQENEGNQKHTVKQL